MWTNSELHFSQKLQFECEKCTRLFVLLSLAFLRVYCVASLLPTVRAKKNQALWLTFCSKSSVNLYIVFLVVIWQIKCAIMSHADMGHTFPSVKISNSPFDIMWHDISSVSVLTLCFICTVCAASNFVSVTVFHITVIYDMANFLVIDIQDQY